MTSARMSLRAASRLSAAGECGLLGSLLHLLRLRPSRNLTLEQQREEVALADLCVTDRRVGRGRVVVRIDHRAARMRAQAVQHGREVGITREDDEFVEIGVMGEDVAYIHHHADIGRVLELRGERRAVDHLESGAQEVMAHEWKRAHVGGVVALVATRDRIAVAAVDDNAALARLGWAVGRGHQAPGFDLLDPAGCVLGEALGRFLVLSFQGQVNVVVVDENCRQNRPK